MDTVFTMSSAPWRHFCRGAYAWGNACPPSKTISVSFAESLESWATASRELRLVGEIWGVVVGDILGGDGIGLSERVGDISGDDSNELGEDG